MPSNKLKKYCQIDVLEAIQVAVPGFKHSCPSCTSRHNASIGRGSWIDKYCTTVNGTTTTLIPDQYYSICYRMKTQVIDKLLPASTNNAANPPGVDIMAAAATVPVLKQEAGARHDPLVPLPVAVAVSVLLCRRMPRSQNKKHPWQQQKYQQQWKNLMIAEW